MPLNQITDRRSAGDVELIVAPGIISSKACTMAATHDTIATTCAELLALPLFEALLTICAGRDYSLYI